MGSKVCVLMLCLGIVLPTGGQEKTAADPAAEKPRVFITDSHSWEIAGGGGGSSAGFGAATRGGARPQTAEIIKTFGERCPEVIINNKQDRADYIVLLDHEGGKGLLRRDNKVAVFNKDGDSIVSRSTASLGNAVKDACGAILKDWPLSAAKLRAPTPGPTATSSTQTVESAAAGNISVSSTPPNADIEIDGNFVGNTPSMIGVTPGEHDVVIKKSGYSTWQRKMKIMSGTINVSAELEKAQ
jgi:PEGA domain-containing protein